MHSWWGFENLEVLWRGTLTDTNKIVCSGLERPRKRSCARQQWL